MKKRNLAVALFCFAVCTTVSAADWIWIGSTKNADYFIDASSMTTSDIYKKAWFMVEHRQARALDDSPGKFYRSVKAMLYIDCKEKMSAEVRQAFYSGSAGSGDDVGSTSRPFSPALLEEPTPETISENFIKSACSTPEALARMRAAQSPRPPTN